MCQSFDGRTCELNPDSMFKINFKSKGWKKKKKSKGWDYSQADLKKRQGKC